MKSNILVSLASTCESCITTRHNWASGFFSCSDWEPTTKDVTAKDALDYAKFLNELADALHGTGALLTVDIAHWGAIWNFTALANTRVDYFMTMGTYTDNPVSWKKNVANAVAQLPSHKLVIGERVQPLRSLYIIHAILITGLETTKASSGAAYTPDELKDRFQYLASLGVASVALWKAPVPEAFWPELSRL
jgi:hypothetical protein